MPSGISDGSDFGGSVFGGGPTQSRFRRFAREQPDLMLELSVFPHGRDGGLRTQIERSARRAGLEPQFVWADDPGDERFVPQILSVDPWNGACTTLPEGAYANATGSTTFGAVCWKLPKRRGGHLEISYVTWRFLQAADYCTSLVVKIVPPLNATAAETAEQKKAATSVVAGLKAWLVAEPPSPASVVLRRHVQGKG